MFSDARIEIGHQFTVGVDLLAVYVVSCHIIGRRHRGGRMLVSGSKGGYGLSVLVSDDSSGNIADYGISESRGVELHGVRLLLLPEGMLVGIAARYIVVQRLEPSGILKVQMSVGREPCSDAGGPGHDVPLLHVGIVALEVVAVAEINGCIGVERAEILAPQELAVQSAVRFVCCGELFRTVCVVNAEIEASGLPRLEPLAGRKLPDAGIRTHPDDIGRSACAGLHYHRSRSHVSVLHGRYSAYDLDRFDIVGGYVAYVDSGRR